MPSRDTGSGGIGGVVMPSSVFKNASDDVGAAGQDSNLHAMAPPLGRCVFLSTTSGILTNALMGHVVGSTCWTRTNGHHRVVVLFYHLN